MTTRLLGEAAYDSTQSSLAHPIYSPAPAKLATRDQERAHSLTHSRIFGTNCLKLSDIWRAPVFGRECYAPLDSDVHAIQSLYFRPSVVPLFWWCTYSWRKYKICMITCHVIGTEMVRPARPSCRFHLRRFFGAAIYIVLFVYMYYIYYVYTWYYTGSRKKKAQTKQASHHWVKTSLFCILVTFTFTGTCRRERIV